MHRCSLLVCCVALARLRVCHHSAASYNAGGWVAQLTAAYCRHVSTLLRASHPLASALKLDHPRTERALPTQHYPTLVFFTYFFAFLATCLPPLLHAALLCGSSNGAR